MFIFFWIGIKLLLVNYLIIGNEKKEPELASTNQKK
jgi:hypothetical protein